MKEISELKREGLSIQAISQLTGFESRLTEVESPLSQLIQQAADHLGIFGRSLYQAQDKLLSESIAADRRHHMLALEDGAIDQ